MTTQTQQKCIACGQVFDGFKELAQHIISLKDIRHKKGKRWAHKFLMKQKFLDQKRDLKPRTPMPENIKSHLDEIKRETSGEVEMVNTLCPHCKAQGRAYLPLEYAQDLEAWKQDSRYVVMCERCKG